MRTLENLLIEAKSGAITGLSIHGTEDGELRTTFVLRDARRDVDMPGVRVEDDEFDDRDTDVDH